MDIGGIALGTWLLSKKLLQKSTWGDLQCLHMEVGRYPQREEITCEAGGTYHLSVDRLFSKTEGQKRTGEGRKEDCFI